MRLQRFVIGVLFNRKMFRLPSLGGSIIDEVLSVSESEKRMGAGFFDQVSTPQTKNGEYSISLINDSKANNFAVLPDQVIFKKTSSSDSASVNVDNVIDEFSVLWKAANKIISFPEVRRIGMVGEYRIKEACSGSAGKQLVDSLTKFPVPESCGRFQLTFDDKGVNERGLPYDKDNDDFWNQINTFYISTMDETPSSNEINANIDVQKYYNPAKRDPLKELILVKKRYQERKAKFKEMVKSLGLES